MSECWVEMPPNKHNAVFALQIFLKSQINRAPKNKWFHYRNSGLLLKKKKNHNISLKRM